MAIFRAVKKEFNFQSVNHLGMMAKAFMIALPAAFANVATYGWPGLFVLSAFTAGMIVKMQQGLDYSLEIKRRSRDLNGQADALSQQLLEIRGRIEALDLWPLGVLNVKTSNTPDTREQRLSRSLSPAFGLPTIRVDYYDKQLIPFATNLREIQIEPTAAERLSDSEIAWVIAHELDHIRVDRDIDKLTPLNAFRKVAMTAGFVTGGMSALNVDASFLPGFTASLSGALLSYPFLKAANSSIWRDVENRCDANALRVTGDLAAAKSALNKVYAIVDERHNRSALRRMVLSPFAKHPSLEARLNNLDRTWETMQGEVQQKPAPVTP